MQKGRSFRPGLFSQRVNARPAILSQIAEHYKVHPECKKAEAFAPAFSFKG